MPLTAADVRAMQFATTRMRSGYDMDEVDAFLDIIEADVAQYADELQRARDGEAVLRTQCDQLQARVEAAERRLAEVQEQLATAGRGSVVVPPEPVVPSDLQAALGEHPEAAEVLAAAQRSAEEIVRHAQVRADAVRAQVRATLDQQRALLDQ